jgi:hypothetical protein
MTSYPDRIEQSWSQFMEQERARLKARRPITPSPRVESGIPEFESRPKFTPLTPEEWFKQIGAKKIGYTPRPRVIQQNSDLPFEIMSTSQCMPVAESTDTIASGNEIVLPNRLVLPSDTSRVIAFFNARAIDESPREFVKSFLPRLTPVQEERFFPPLPIIKVKRNSGFRNFFSNIVGRLRILRSVS